MKLKKSNMGRSSLFMIVIVLLIGLLSYVYINNRPTEAVTQENSGNFKVETLFEHKGCLMHRFYDAGKPIYYATCNNESSNKVETNWTRKESCGKGCSKDIVERVESIRKNPTSSTNDISTEK